ncbi:MAG: hypothetical protein NC898_03675 [Candidatus Omnitrophica bacterium]|nr:hypothetical protein [Candidatus Omnitrophota bacterium]MCM8793550.1 hypothetical protein [Candidatus Omnitrophota bacterium]
MIRKKKGIVVNTSPWVALSICGKVSLLKNLYTEVYMPLGREKKFYKVVKGVLE